MLQTQDKMLLEECKSADILFQRLNEAMNEAMNNSQQDRLLALLGHCNSIVTEDNNYIQNIFYSMVFETLQKILLQTAQRPALLMTIKTLTNIFA